MGILARLFRRSKATEQAPAAEAQTDAATAGSEAEKASGTEEAAPVREADGAADSDGPAAAAAETGETGGVDIPQQQSTDKAADNEAGESART
ncbi:hypothetical protein ABZ499_17630 [Streptomyces sp. NPDC019990]|uniref:hypothetical protein n=1 Tax=Streptomyces sp. NPDC019990 TaxID=3154693 RepID=UPI0033D89EBB